ncbi:hypothetical protein NC652_027138 [Populus alba x Populus x berolinensis]|nr:hypothetical protein NC652_027138 [Populus alba x Populus x berolinensis]
MAALTAVAGSSINDGSWHGREGIWRSSWWAMYVYNTYAELRYWHREVIRCLGQRDVLKESFVKVRWMQTFVKACCCGTLPPIFVTMTILEQILVLMLIQCQDKQILV